MDDITVDFDNRMYAEYMYGLYGVEVGYKSDPLWLCRLNYIIAKWQYDFDCAGTLCTDSRSSGVNVVSACGGFGSSPFPQIMSSGCCTTGHHHIGRDLL